ncbi:HD-domain/PDEase-like protein [Rozella allomycis CSF55]|uniref:Phosphodiesterase n=1 Tax=Rozella allomycis (strain CSF55) TaxID=988480 RepID=A0A075B588_ROZAC|nr:3'5'-cyclic nucleotide phosphodiesterase domain-containing protein [Rozella allomycis CSF55]RKP19407.1 HD-domain/PDEase-like protein [Rozella allomycis CSF55]|eukprot:EPZ36858.1 3'5'-cyclic nucleotide phosphodiesterase domain-containing protein [Rozella allomycis CSF55]
MKSVCYNLVCKAIQVSNPQKIQQESTTLPLPEVSTSTIEIVQKPKIMEYNKFSLKFTNQNLESEFISFMEKGLSASSWLIFAAWNTSIAITGFLCLILVRSLTKMEYSAIHDISMLFLFWIVPWVLFAGIVKFVCRRFSLMRYVSWLAVICNWMTIGAGVFAWFEPRGSPTTPATIFITCIITFHILNYIPFRTTMVSIMGLLFQLISLFVKNEYFEIQECFFTVFSVSICCVVAAYIAYQQEHTNRKQFFESEVLATTNKKLIDQLKNLQRSYGKNAVDLDSPLEKVTNYIRLLMADPEITTGQLEILMKTMEALNSDNLLAPNLDQQPTFLSMDEQQKNWLFSEIVKKNPALLNPKRRKSVQSLACESENEEDCKHSCSKVGTIVQKIHRQLSSPVLKIKEDSDNHSSELEEIITSFDLEETFSDTEDFVPLVSQILQKVDDWNFDIFSFDQSTNGRPLVVLSLFLFRKYALFDNLQIPEEKFMRCINSIQSGYRSDITYHTCVHAADVLHATYYFFSKTQFRDLVTDLDLAALFFAAIIHDVGHGGFNNNFLATTLDEKAIMYNDKSILENHHLTTGFNILMKEENNFLKDFGKNEFKEFRSAVIELVLATDLAKHFEILSLFRAKISNEESKFLPNESKDDQLLLFKIVIKAADVCNSTKAFDLHLNWVHKVLEEFFRQGDEEKRLGLPVSPLMDRETVNLASSQSGFIEFICHPLFEALHKFEPIPVVLEGLESNRTHWLKEIESQKKSSEVSSASDDQEKKHLD